MACTTTPLAAATSSAGKTAIAAGVGASGSRRRRSRLPRVWSCAIAADHRRLGCARNPNMLPKSPHGSRTNASVAETASTRTRRLKEPASAFSSASPMASPRAVAGSRADMPRPLRGAVDRVFVLKGSSRRGEIYADPTGPAVEPLRSRAVEQQIVSPAVPLPLRAVSMRRSVSGVTFAASDDCIGRR